MARSPRQLRRVVVTGIGAVTPLGLSFSSSWKALLNNASGVVPITKDEDRLHHLSPHFSVAAPVLGFSSDHPERTTPRAVQFALHAAQEAMNDGIILDAAATTGVSIGCGMSGVDVIAANASNLKRLSPHFVPNVLPNTAAARVAHHWQLHGPNLCPATACAAGAHALGDAMRWIQLQDGIGAMLAGGTEACLDPVSVAGFARMRALASEASRPLDVRRDGFVMGEGACVMILQDLEQVRQEYKGRVVVEMIGYGAAGDAHHATAPDPEGRGAIRAMRMALAEAGLERVDYVNAHATSTPLGDEIEAKAIAEVFAQQPPPYVSSTKGATGHLLGAAGALECAFTVQSLLEQTVPHTRNLETPVDVDGVNFVQDEPLFVPNLTTAMSNSFGFGGTNVCLVFRRIEL